MSNRIIFLFLVILLLSVGSMAIWLYELSRLVELTGTEMDWVKTQRLSIFAITASTIFAYLLPFELLKNKSIAEILLPFALLFVFALVAFYFMRFEIKLFFSRGYVGNRTLLFLQMLAIPYLIGYGFYFVTRRFLLPVRTRLKYQISFGIVLVIPLSLLSMRIFNGFSGDGLGIIEAIKMGFPFFWTTLIMGIIGVVAVRQAEEEKVVKESRPDILDDIF